MVKLGFKFLLSVINRIALSTLGNRAKKHNRTLHGFY
jgi:hypothetical protein